MFADRPALDAASFKAKYGPWAVIVGASDGTGAAYARQLAALGLNLVLVARRFDPLYALAAEVEKTNGIATRAVSIDLFEAGAGARLLQATEGLEVGLYISNTGTDLNDCQFLDTSFEAWRQLINRNVLAVAEAAHGFAAAMRKRGRGGLLFMSSGTALGGRPGVAVYSATKAFDLNFAESLWAELSPHGINVLSAVCPAMNTPSTHKIMEKRGGAIPGAYDPDDVVRTLLTRLSDGPVHIFPFGPQAAEAETVERARRERITRFMEAAKKMFGKQ